MDNYWFNKLLDVLMVQTNSENEKLMVLYLDKELKKLKIPYYIDSAGNVIVTKGLDKAKTYPCVTSHMDTVHNFANSFKIYKDTDDMDVLFAMNGKKRTGIGGDDKCGVFGCLYLLKVIPQIKVVFFSREEAGCKGSTAIDKRFFADCRYLIQLDRRSSSDFIQTYWGDKTISHDFSSEIGLIKKKYGYKNCMGSVTDVMKLWKNKVGVSCINLSCGYYKPHTSYEYISISDLWNSVKFTEEIINKMKPKRYTSSPPAVTTVGTYPTSAYKSKYDQCYKCKQWKKDALLYEHYDSTVNQNKKICWPCKKGHGIKELDETKTKDTHSGSYCRECKEWKVTTLHTVNHKVMCYGCKQKYLNKTEHSTLQNGEIVTFACTECGIKTSEMQAGGSLTYADDGKLYCNECTLLFDIPDKDKTPKKCWVCHKVIPKDHKIIKRYDMDICEDCACPSDTEYVVS